MRKETKLRIITCLFCTMTVFLFFSAKATATVAVTGENLIFRPISIQDANGVHNLGGSGNYGSFDNFVAEAGIPSLVEFKNQKSYIVDNETIAYSADAVFEVTMNVRTEAPWEKAVTKTPVPTTWFTIYHYWQGSWCESPWTRIRPDSVYALTYNDYVPVISVSYGEFAHYWNLGLECGWANDLESFDFKDPATGVAINYKFDWQITSLSATGADQVTQLEDYQDQIKTVQQTVSASLVNVDGSIERDAGGALTTSEWNVMATAKQVATRGVKLIYTDSADYHTWSTSGGQQSLVSSPTEGVSFISAGARPDPNENAIVKLAYNLKPQVSFARQLFNINWGTYDLLKSECWTNPETRITSAYEGTNTVPRNIAVRVNNYNIQQKYRITMKCRSDVTMEKITSETLIGMPNYARGDMIWDAFLTGDTQAIMDYTSITDWRDIIKDIGVGIGDVTNWFSWVWPLLGVAVIVVALYVTVSVVRARNARRALAG